MRFLTRYVWPNEYKYYDTPDGDDCFQKVFYCSKHLGTKALVYGPIHVLAYPHGGGFGPAFARCLKITLLGTGIGAVFASTVCTSTNLRKKDDEVNYAIGGFSTGLFCGAAFKSVKFALHAGAFCAFCSAIWKYSLLNNYDLLHGLWGDVRSYPYNFWFIEDRSDCIFSEVAERQWTKNGVKRMD